MFRLFTAIDLPVQYKHELLSRMGGLPHVRWQTEDQIHLTLRFIGGVEERRAEEIRLLLASIDYKPFPLKVSGVGIFGNRRKARMIWAGVNKSGPLKALQEKITNVLRRAGVPPEERKYTPHITLARVKGDNGTRLQEFLKNNRDLSLPEFEVSEFRLLQSHLGGTGAHYRVVEIYLAKSISEAG